MVPASFTAPRFSSREEKTPFLKWFTLKLVSDTEREGDEEGMTHRLTGRLSHH